MVRVVGWWEKGDWIEGVEAGVKISFFSELEDGDRIMD